MGTYARLYIGAILAGGVACFAHAMAGWNCRHPLQYLCLLAVALPASTLKVFLPGVTGTISVSYVFVLLGMLDFSYPETVLLACLAMFVQSLWRARHHPKMLRASFNLASTAIAVSVGFLAQDDYVARMGGDEFGLVLPGLKIEHLPKILMALEKVVVESGLAVCGERLLNIGIGAAFYPENGADAEGLLAEAERRMHLVKRRLKKAAPSEGSDLANLAAQIEDSAACAPHSALLQ
jgi:hypothetical protein